jgi:hypothetical protein
MASEHAIQRMNMRRREALISARAGCLGSLPRDVSAGARGGGCLPWRLMRCWGGCAAEVSWSQSKVRWADSNGEPTWQWSSVVNIRNALGQVSVVQGPGLPFEGPLGLGAGDQRRAADLLGDASQGVVQRGEEPGGRGRGRRR